MSIQWESTPFADLSQADREALLSWLRQAWEKLSQDARESGNSTAYTMVMGWWRDATGLTDSSSSADVLTNIDHYQTAYAYGLAHPTSTGRIHAAPPTNAALPWVIVTGERVDSGPPATGGFFADQRGSDLWTALANESVQLYPGGDSLRGAIAQWQDEFMADSSGLGIPRSNKSGIRSGRLLRVAQARVAADRARAAGVNPTPAVPTPRGDTTQVQASSRGGGLGDIAPVAFGLWLLYQVFKK